MKANEQPGQGASIVLLPRRNAPKFGDLDTAEFTPSGMGLRNANEITRTQLGGTVYLLGYQLIFSTTEGAHGSGEQTLIIALVEEGGSRAWQPCSIVDIEEAAAAEGLPTETDQHSRCYLRLIEEEQKTATQCVEAMQAFHSGDKRRRVSARAHWAAQARLLEAFVSEAALEGYDPKRYPVPLMALARLCRLTEFLKQGQIPDSLLEVESTTGGKTLRHPEEHRLIRSAVLYHRAAKDDDGPVTDPNHTKTVSNFFGLDKSTVRDLSRNALHYAPELSQGWNRLNFDPDDLYEAMVAAGRRYQFNKRDFGDMEREDLRSAALYLRAAKDADGPVSDPNAERTVAQHFRLSTEDVESLTANWTIHAPELRRGWGALQLTEGKLRDQMLEAGERYKAIQEQKPVDNTGDE